MPGGASSLGLNGADGVALLVSVPMLSLAGRRVSLSALGQQCCQNLEILLCGRGVTAGGLQTSAVNCLHWTATYMQDQKKEQFAVCLKLYVAKISMPTN